MECRVCVCESVCVCACVHVCSCVCVHVHMGVHSVYVCMCMCCTWMCGCVDVYVCMCMDRVGGFRVGSGGLCAHLVRVVRGVVHVVRPPY